MTINAITMSTCVNKHNRVPVECKTRPVAEYACSFARRFILSSNDLDRLPVFDISAYDTHAYVHGVRLHGFGYQLSAHIEF